MARTIPAGLLERAREAPDAPALVFEDVTLTRGALAMQAAAIADGLRRRGVRRGDRVAVFLDKSADAVAALLGVWRAGGAYVPLDPTGPAPRLAAILADAEAAALVSAPAKARRLEAIAAEGLALPPVLLLGAEEDAPAPVEPAAELPIEDDLACLLYTSGSTGRPKGVMITHRNIAAFSDWAGRRFAIGAGDRVAAHAPLHFDLSLLDVWTALDHGATVCLVPQGLGFLGVDLARFVASSRITVWQSVPSVLKLMTPHLSPEDPGLAALRLVLFAGEPFAPPALRELMRCLPRARFVNIYGSTEMNDVTAHDIAALPDDGPLPIGAPCEHMQVLVVDDAGQVVTAPGAIGELWAREPTVAKGYWRAPELTRERFVQNPTHAEFDDPVYRSGDLVEIGADGLLRFVGRRDVQVKIRGNRVNLGEVEEAVASHPDIAEAAVIDIAADDGGRSLCAVIVVAPGRDITMRDLRRHCAARLPAYMVPETMETRDGLPRTSTGKVDRQALRRDRAAPAPSGAA